MSNKIAISATINADKSKVWDYYTKPEHIIKWNFADPSWCCPFATNDLRVGGKITARMEAKDGSFGFEFGGVYEAVEEGKSMTYTMGDGRQVEVVFDGDDRKVDVKVAFDPESENPEEMQKNGWEAILTNFKTYTEAN